MILSLLSFFMNDDKYIEWCELIDKQKIKKSAKDELKRYVRDMLDRNGIIILTVHHLASLVGLQTTEVCKMIETPEKYYRHFFIPKRHGGSREISAPYPSLMSAQEWIYREILLPRYECAPCATGFVPGKSIKDNAQPHCGNRVVLQMDLKDFFPSITLNRVINVFRYQGYYNQMAYYLAALSCKDGVLPQGAPTSPMLSNIIAGRMDKRLMGLCEKFSITYTRYADDLTFSGEHIGRSFIRLVTEIIQSEGFQVNESKTKLLKDNARKIITGVSISSGKTTIPKARKRRLRQEAYYISKYGMKNHMEHENIRDGKYMMRLRGHFAYWKSVDEGDNVNKEFRRAFPQNNGGIRKIFHRLKFKIKEIGKRK